MDIKSILGFVLGIIVILIGIFFTGSGIGLYFDFSSVFIVILAPIAAMAISFDGRHFKNFLKYIGVVFQTRKFDRERLLSSLVYFAENARKEGILSLDDKLESIEDEFLREGMRLVIDGTDPEMIKKILYTEIQSIDRRHQQTIQFFDVWSKITPAFGMIGTLIGLIALLANLQDKSAISVGMSVALLTTLYGVLIANLILIPMKENLVEKNDDEISTKELIVEGVLSIQAGASPRILARKLTAFFTPQEKNESFNSALKNYK